MAVAWLWDPGEDGPARSWGLLYAPGDAPPPRGRAGGLALECSPAVVDDFHWCTFT